MAVQSLAPRRIPVPGICGLVDRGTDAAPLAFVRGDLGHDADKSPLIAPLKAFEVCNPQLGLGLSLRPLDLVAVCHPEHAPPAHAAFGCAAYDPVTRLTYITLGHALYCVDGGGNLQWVCGDGCAGPGGVDGEAQAARFAQPGRLSVRDAGTLAVLDANGLRVVSLIAPGRCGSVQTVPPGGNDCAQAVLLTAEDTQALLTVWPRGHHVLPSSPFPRCPSQSLSPSSPANSYHLTGGGTDAGGLHSITGVAALPPHGYTTTTSFSLAQDTTGTSTCARRADLLLTDARQDGSFTVHHVTWLHSACSGRGATAAAAQVCTVFDSAQVAAWEVACGVAFTADCSADAGSEPAAADYSISSSINTFSSSDDSGGSCVHLANAGTCTPGSGSILRSVQYGWVEVEVVDEDIQSAPAAAPRSPSSAAPSAFAAAATTATAAMTVSTHGPRGGGVDLTDAPSMDSGELSYSCLPCYSPCNGDNGYGNLLTSGGGAAGVSGDGGGGCCGALPGDEGADGVWRCGGVRYPVALPGGLLLLVCPLEGQLLLLHLPQLAQPAQQPQHQEEQPAAVAAPGGADCNEAAAAAACGDAEAAKEAGLPLPRRRISCGSSSNIVGDCNFHWRGDGSDTGGEHIDSGEGAADSIMAAAAAAADVPLECSSSDISGGEDWHCGDGYGDPGVSSGVYAGSSTPTAAWTCAPLPYTPARRQLKRRRWECLVEAAAAIHSNNRGRYKRARQASKEF